VLAEEARARLALWRIPSVGPKLFSEVMHAAGSAKKALAHTADYPTLKPIHILKHPDWKGADNDLQWATQKDAHIIFWDQPEYPSVLKEIAYPPPILFVYGKIETLLHPQIAIVGSRHPTTLGRETAYQFAHALAEIGLTITSGLAMGIDGSAHEGAITTKNGTTIAVMGTGLTHVYPKKHVALAERIRHQGAWVSEFPSDFAPKAHHFPRRNRIISGMSLGVLVVEASLGSGSLITARYAVEQNREVFAIPGSIHNPLSKGGHTLLRQGAILTETISDITEALTGLISLFRPTPPSTHLLGIQPDKRLTPSESRLFACLTLEPISFDMLIKYTELTPAEVSSILASFEIEGWVTSSQHGYYRSIEQRHG